MKNQLKQKQNSNPAGQNGRLICIYLFLIFLSFPHATAQSSNQAPPASPFAFGYYFNPSVFIVLITIVSAFLMLFFISVCLHRCYRIDEASVRVNSVENQMSRRRRRGLDAAVIEGFPTFAYSHVKDHKLGNGALECAVCLNEFEDDDKIRLLPKCDHVFHAECIDAWISKHTTCPVCRADLVPAPGETPVITQTVQDIEGENPIPEEENEENEQVSINLASEEPEMVAVAVAPEAINQTPMQNRPVRSMKPGFLERFPRSHSTGHSLVQPGEDLERFTLRLPDEVRKQIMNMRQLNRTRSMESFPGLESPRKDYRMTDEGSNRGEKSIREKPEGWVFSVTPPFFIRAFSPRAPKIIIEGAAPSSPRSKPFMSPLRVFAITDRTGLSAVRSPV